MAGKKKGFVFLLILFMSIFSLDVLFVQMQNSRYTHQGNGGKEENSIALTISELDSLLQMNNRHGKVPILYCKHQLFDSPLGLAMCVPVLRSQLLFESNVRSDDAVMGKRKFQFRY